MTKPPHCGKLYNRVTQPKSTPQRDAGSQDCRTTPVFADLEEGVPFGDLPILPRNGENLGDVEEFLPRNGKNFDDVEEFLPLFGTSEEMDALDGENTLTQQGTFPPTAALPTAPLPTAPPGNVTP
eukprot:889715-Rhodomonas_salina.1